MKVLLSFVTSVRPLTFIPKDSPQQASNPNTISVRFGRSNHHTSKERITGNRYCNHFGKTLHSQFDSLQSSQVYVSFILISLTLNPQFMTAIETSSIFLLLAHLQRLQRVTIYTSQEGEAHTPHNELHELNTTPAPNTQRMQH